MSLEELVWLICIAKHVNPLPLWEGEGPLNVRTPPSAELGTGGGKFTA